MKISGFIWLLAGIFMIGFSLFINSRVDSQKLSLFVWVGIFFSIIGIYKIIVWLPTIQKKPKLAKENFQHQPAQKPPAQFVKFCANCGTALRHFDKFCMKCGSRMFKK